MINALMVVLALAMEGQAPGAHASDEMERVGADEGISVATKYATLAALWESTVGASFADLRSMPLAELQAAFTATDRVLFYALLAGERAPGAWGDRLAAAHDELVRRGVEDAARAESLFDQLLALRRFDEAASLKASTPALSKRLVPVVRIAPGFDEALPAAMTLREDGEWDVQNVSIPDSAVVALVGCPTSAAAVAEINDVADVASALDDAGVIWLSDASALAMEGLAAWWREEFPRQPLRIAWRNHTWPHIEFDSMPKFHFLRGGRVVAKHEGWGDDSLAELSTALGSHRTADSPN